MQQDNLILVQKNQSLEADVVKYKTELEQKLVAIKGANDKVSLLQQEVEELQCQITGYVRAVETSREEVMDLEAQLEAVRVQEAVDQDGKGNSLFSEVLFISISRFFLWKII